MKILQVEYKILIYNVSKVQSQIRYILRDMIPPCQGSSLFQDSSLNMTRWDNFYVLGYKFPNEIYEDVIERAQNTLSMVQVSNPEDETVTRGIPYSFAILNSPVTGHLGKMIISPNW